jgi:tetratricopeptide (TPR) repeat protein
MKYLFVFVSNFLILFNTLAQNEQAQSLVEKERYNEASAIYKSLLKTDAKRASDYYYYLGDICWRKEKNDSARYYFMEGLKMDETEPMNYVGIGKVSMNKNPVEGQRSFDKALLMTKEKNIEVLNAIGEYYVLEASKEDLTKGISYLQKGTVEEPKNAYAWMFLGDAYGRLGEGSKQVECYNKADVLFHPQALLKMKYGKLYTAARNFDLSVKFYKEGLAIDSTYGPIYHELGELYSKFKKYDLSIQNYRKYLMYIDRNSDVEYRYVTFLFFNKDYKDALDILKKLESQRYENVKLYRLKGICDYETGDYDQAQKDLEVFFKKADPKIYLCMDYEYYGKTLLKKGQDSLAILSMEQAVALDTARVDLYGDIGTYYYGKENYSVAIKYMSKQAALTPNDPQIFLNTGKAYYYNKQYLQADSCFARVVMLKPNIYLGYLFRARVNSALDPETKQGLAKPFYEKVIEICSANTTKNKNELIEAYEYTGYYYIVNRDKVKSDVAWNKIIQLDPGNKKAADGLKIQ